MPARPPDPSDLPRRDLEAVVQAAVTRDGHLLTAGEARVVDRLLALPPAPLSLFARLLARQPNAFAVDRLHYAEVADVADAANCLAESGLATWANRQWPLARLLPALTLPELKTALRTDGLPRSGRKQVLIDRLVAAGSRAPRARARLALRHRALLRRLIRLGLHDPRGRLDRLVLGRLGLVRYPVYTPTGGAGLFTTRTSVLAWERGMQLRYSLDEQGLLDHRAAAVGRVESTPQPTPLRHRWSGRRHDEGIALAAAALLEKSGQPALAAETYQRLLTAGLRDKGHARLRLAMCHDALGQPAAGAQVCADGLTAPLSTLTHDPEARALARTGRRLSRKARVGWRPLPPLREPAERRVSIPAAPAGPRRPRYRVGEQDLAVEDALVAALHTAGRTALHVETALWTTLFALLLRPALFAPVPGMLPTALLTGPLDLRTPGFRSRRMAIIDERLDALRNGAGAALLDDALTAHTGESIVGARWDRVGPDALRVIVRDLPGPALAGVLDVLATDWRATSRGLPDLVVLPGPALRLPHSRPGRLTPGVLLVEVKGPTDTLSDAQRVWLSRLIRAGVPTELWRVEPTG